MGWFICAYCCGYCSSDEGCATTPSGELVCIDCAMEENLDLEE